MKLDERACEAIQRGEAVLGIELGSTRIKAVLLDGEHRPVAAGEYRWENKLDGKIWTYSLQEAMEGVAAAYRAMASSLHQENGVEIRNLAGVGISAMMHGYLPFDGEGRLLAPFRTWRNTITGQASEELSRLFGFAVPQRWSVAHLYQAVLNGEAHVRELRFLTTLAGYVHWQLTGVKALGVGDASGMFPLGADGAYDQRMLKQFSELVKDKGYPWDIGELLPEIRRAGEPAGFLTERGAKLLDADGLLRPGAPFCPPEGDAGTGMVATNAVAPRTGNVSAGTSIFAMIVLEQPLSRIHPEIDIVATPAGSPVAMVHCNNCTTDLNAWVSLFEDFCRRAGLDISQDALYSAFFDAAEAAEPDAGGLTGYGYFSGEHITGFEEGRPLLVYPPQARFSFANLARSILFSSLATLSIGMEVLREEQVKIDSVLGHGGLYKGGAAGQRFTAAALSTPVSVMETAGEGGAWGAGLLAAYMAWKPEGESLPDYLNGKVFDRMSGSRLDPDPRDVEGFQAYVKRFKAGFPVQRAAVDRLGKGKTEGGDA